MASKKKTASDGSAAERTLECAAKALQNEISPPENRYGECHGFGDRVLSRKW